MNFKLFAAIATFFFAACDTSSDADDGIRKDALAFAENYFNFDFHAASDHSTPEGRKWIGYVASNVSEADLIVLRSYGHAAEVEVNAIDTQNDSTVIVTLSVSDFMSMDSIGRPGHIVDEAVFRLPMVRRQDRWLVRMEGPLRSEK